MLDKQDSKNNSSPEVAEVQGLACEYATFCITDNPVHRASLMDHEGVHQVIVNLVDSGFDTSSYAYAMVSATRSYTSTMACHLISIASFANAENHALFYEADAVSVLAILVKNKDYNRVYRNVDRQVRPVQTMWATAALQNLASSYCATPDDGRCHWAWPSNRTSILPEITKESLPLLIDGSRVRYDMLQDTALVERLITLARQGPVTGMQPSSTNPFPGVNAVAHTVHDDSSTIVPWAAAGVIKNLARRRCW